MFRRLLSLNRSQLPQSISRRSFATGELPVSFRDHFVEATGHDEYVNCWEAPMSPSKWKKEHVVFAVLGGWTVVIYGARKFFSGGKSDQATTPAKAST